MERLNATAVRLSWKATTVENVIGYYIYFSYVTEIEKADGVQKISVPFKRIHMPKAGSVLTFDIDGLVQGFEYSFKVQAYNENGQLA